MPHPSSTLLKPAELADLKPKVTTVRCKHCSNHCLLTISDFGVDPASGKHRRFITGNRCERGTGVKPLAAELPNLFTYKRQRLFDGPSDTPYLPLDPASAPRPTIGIPRVLNAYENYPFWFTFFTTLGFSVQLSEETRKSTYEAGIESMPSESVCYPAKLVHGHIMDLLQRGRNKAIGGEQGGLRNGTGSADGGSQAPIDIIWMPCIRYERQEDPGATNHYNCPVVVSYSEVIKLNVEEIGWEAESGQAGRNAQGKKAARGSRGSNVLSGSPDKPAFLNPFLPYDHRNRFIQRISEELAAYYAAYPTAKGSMPSTAEIAAATDAAWAEDQHFKDDIRAAGLAALAWIKDTGSHGIVLAGRPYHLDPEINHAIPELLAGFGLAVLTEDSVAHFIRPERPLRVVDQWMFHTRLYAAAKYCTTRDDLDLIQLNSFGCGLDAITTDQVQEILEAAGKIYTVLKIDEVSNLGAARIRLRSLLAALRDQKGPAPTAPTVPTTPTAPVTPTTPTASVTPNASATATTLSAPTAPNAPGTAAAALSDQQALSGAQAGAPPDPQAGAPRRRAVSTAFPKAPYTEQMKTDKYTILSPQMAPIHFDLLVQIFQQAGYNFELLPSVDKGAVEVGLKYANNDVCYPSIMVTGQIMEAVTSGRYDMDRTAVIITQTGGGCRATNYISLIRKALREAGYPQVPVIGLSFHSLGEKNPGFNIKLDMLRRAIYAFYYGDLLMQCLYRTRPYERDPGSASRLFDSWMEVCRQQLLGRIGQRIFARTVRRMVQEFDRLPLANDRSKPRIGIVGEILVKFHPTANNGIVELIESEGCEAVVPGLTEFFLFGISGGIWQHHTLSKGKKSAIGSRLSIGLFNFLRRPMNKALRKSQRFEPAASIYQLARYAEDFISLCNSMGEGWLLTAEMVELIHGGTPNIVCTQPFACLPNHVTGKGVIKALRQMNPASNIVAVDYDPGASEVNQLNRIKLMISIAKDNFGR
ncbi:MAG: acyl-CoA dehydratase activase-related protein [Actinomycetia bacterium]|nr:acyl-CoA dehydratase activase-related protein [Actinomycetes bacterium]